MSRSFQDILAIFCFSFPGPGLTPTARRGTALHLHSDLLLFQDLAVVHVARVSPELRVLQWMLVVWPTGLLEHQATMDSLQNGSCLQAQALTASVPFLSLWALVDRDIAVPERTKLTTWALYPVSIGICPTSLNSRFPEHYQVFTRTWHLRRQASW